MSYVPHGENDITQMLAEIGLTSVDELFSDIPSSLRLSKSLDIPPAQSEFEVINHFRNYSTRNKTTFDFACFLGGGFYDHHVPAVIDTIVSRGEFLSAYTPYQAEASQGTLQAIFEFQTSIARLCGLDIANASMYDGATAMAEAIRMVHTMQDEKRHEIVLDASINPRYKDVAKTYFDSHPDINLHDEAATPYHPSLSPSTTTTALVLQYPAFNGSVSPSAQDIIDEAKRAGALVIVVYYPIALGLLKPLSNVDIAVGDGQSLGNPLAFGGPHFGFFACSQKNVRKMPGRLVGQTKSQKNEETYCLTLQTREQHIRRDRATSNICTNHSLCAIRGQIYLALAGGKGLKSVAQQCYHKAHYLANLLSTIPNVKVVTKEPFFNEFVIEFAGNLQKILSQCEEKGYLLGVPLDNDKKDKNQILVAVTEKRAKAQIDGYAETLRNILGNQ